jgi:hypothetical protein
MLKNKDIKDLLNHEFNNFGIEPDDYKLEEQFKGIVDLEQSRNLYIAVRVNLYDEIKIVSYIKLDELSII